MGMRSMDMFAVETHVHRTVNVSWNYKHAAG